MDEFLVAIMSGIALILYSFITFWIFRSKWKVYVRWGIIIFLVIVIFLYWSKRKLTKRYLNKLGMDAESYMFYQKYTSAGNRFAYIFTYLLQDFIYEVKKTNKSYNFSKGMFRFDDSLGEYYIDCRMAWYSYMKMNLLKNKLSLHKLRIFSLDRCNHMILELFPQQQEAFQTVKKAFAEEVNQLPPKKKPRKGTLKKIPESQQLHKLLCVNLYESEVSRKFMMDRRPEYLIMEQKAEKRKDDLRGIKNFQIDLNLKEKDR